MHALFQLTFFYLSIHKALRYSNNRHILKKCSREEQKGNIVCFSKAIIKVRVFNLEQEQWEELAVGQHLDNVPMIWQTLASSQKVPGSVCAERERTAALLDIGLGLSPCGWERQEAF